MQLIPLQSESEWATGFQQPRGSTVRVLEELFSRRVLNSPRQLTKSLLERDFGIRIDLPDDRLCPPVRATFHASILRLTTESVLLGPQSVIVHCSSMVALLF